jgi:hypothetical protein
MVLGFGQQHCVEHHRAVVHAELVLDGDAGLLQRIEGHAYLPRWTGLQPR